MLSYRRRTVKRVIVCGWGKCRARCEGWILGGLVGHVVAAPLVIDLLFGHEAVVLGRGKTHAVVRCCQSPAAVDAAATRPVW